MPGSSPWPPLEAPPSEILRFGPVARAAPEMSEAELKTLLERVEHQVRAANTPLQRLKRLQTPTRQSVLILAVIASVFAGIFVVGARPDAGPLTAAKTGLYLGSMGLLIGLSLTLALRPLHRPAPSRALILGVVGVSLLGMAMWAWLPQDVGLASHGAALPCLVHGILFGLPVYTVARVLDRGGVFHTAIFAASVAGLTAHVALETTCPITAPEHTLIGHVGAAACFVVAVALVGVAMPTVARHRSSDPRSSDPRSSGPRSSGPRS